MDRGRSSAGNPGPRASISVRGRHLAGRSPARFFVPGKLIGNDQGLAMLASGRRLCVDPRDPRVDVGDQLFERSAIVAPRRLGRRRSCRGAAQDASRRAQERPRLLVGLDPGRSRSRRSRARERPVPSPRRRGSRRSAAACPCGAGCRTCLLRPPPEFACRAAFPRRTPTGDEGQGRDAGLRPSHQGTSACSHPRMSPQVATDRRGQSA